MKKSIKITSAFMAAMIMMCISISSFFAETIHTVYGFSFTVVSNTEISICGWDNSSSDVVFPDSIAYRYVARIANNAFTDNDTITSVDFSQTTRFSSIGVRAFSNCTSLNCPVEIPNTVTEIKNGAFFNCTSLPSAYINANISEINRETFYNCTSLKNVTIPSTVTKIGELAFSYCPSLEYLEIPAGVDSIGDYAFYGDENLVLGVYKDSYGLQYAEENEIDHIILDGDKIGDVNGDGVVDILDATEIQKYAAESTDFTDEQFELGDINKDGYCDVIDALLVQKSVIGAYELPQNIIRY